MTLVATSGIKGDPSVRAFRGSRRLLEAAAGRLAFTLGREGADSDEHQDADLSIVSDTYAGVSATTVADAYRRSGLACIRDLDAGFSFLLYDHRRQHLVGASGFSSTMPLAYWSDGTRTVLSSRVLQILAFEGASPKLDELYLAHLLTGTWSAPPGRTPVAAVRRILGGMAAIVRGGEIEIVSVDRFVPRGPAGHSRRAWNETLWHEMEAAVDTATSPGPSCVSLSGGLDSAAVASTILHRRQELNAFSILAPRRAVDERREIDAFECSYPGRIKSRHIDCSDATNLDGVALLDLPDDPTFTPLSLLPARLRLWRAVRAAGFVSLLDGEGGDEIFGVLCRPWQAVLQGNPGDALREILGRIGARRAILTRSLLLPGAPAWIRRQWVQRQVERFDRHPGYMSASARDGSSVAEALYEYFDSHVDPGFVGALERWLSTPFTVGARTTQRHLASTFGLRLASPFVDRRVLEVALGIPAQWMFSGDHRSAGYKPFLRAAAQGRVPEEVRLARKDNVLGEDLFLAIVTSPSTRALLSDPCVRHRLEDWVRFDRVEGLLSSLARGYKPADPLFWRQIEGLVGFAAWYPRASRQYGVT